MEDGMRVRLGPRSPSLAILARKMRGSAGAEEVSEGDDNNSLNNIQEKH